MLGSHLLKSWASTPLTITLSQGEAGLRGDVRGSAAGLVMLPLLTDHGVQVRLGFWPDSTASIWICSRQGLDKVRKLDVQDLQVQQRVRSGDCVALQEPRRKKSFKFLSDNLQFGLSQHRTQMLLQL